MGALPKEKGPAAASWHSSSRVEGEVALAYRVWVRVSSVKRSVAVNSSQLGNPSLANAGQCLDTHKELYPLYRYNSRISTSHPPSSRPSRSQERHRQTHMAGNAQCEARLSPEDVAHRSLFCQSPIRHWSRPPILFQAKCHQTRLLSVKRGAACPAMPCT